MTPRFIHGCYSEYMLTTSTSLLTSYLCNFFSLAGWYEYSLPLCSGNEMTGMLSVCIRFGAVFYIPLFYQAVDGLNAFDAGIRLLPGIIGAVIGSLASGFIIQKTGRVRTTIAS